MGRRAHAEWGQESRRMRVVLRLDQWADLEQFGPAPGSELGHRVRMILTDWLRQEALIRRGVKEADIMSAIIFDRQQQQTSRLLGVEIDD